MSLTQSTTTPFIPVVIGSTKRSTAKQYATTEAQLEVWLASKQSVEANCAYNEIASIWLTGDLDTDRIKVSLQNVVERHGALRSTFGEDGQTVLVHDTVEIDIRYLDLSGQSGETLEQSLASVVQTEARTPFDTENGPLFRAVLQKLDHERHKLTFTGHHLILDGWSLALFCRDLGYFYDRLSGVNRDPLSASNQYEEYAQAITEYHQSDAGKTDEQFWVNHFQDEIPVLDLPTTRQRPNLRTYVARRYDHLLPVELIDQVQKLGARSGCSLFNTMLAAFNCFVARISGNDDFCIGIPTAGQAAMDRTELMGHCVNTMPLRTKIDTAESFETYLKQSRTELLDAFDHQRYSYGTLLRRLAPPRDPSRPPMISVSFNLDPVIDRQELGFHGFEVEVVVEPRLFENLEWFINGVIREDRSVELQVQYNTDLFSAEAMAFYFDGFETFLHELAANPDIPILQPNVMNIAQRQQVIVDWNQTELEIPSESTLHQEFTRQANLTPDKVAVQFDDQKLTYQQVEMASNQVARYLQSEGVKAGDLVGICVERSAEMLVNLFGILKSGAGYVPLDPAYPIDRLQYMCDHSGLKLVVTQQHLIEKVRSFGKPMILMDQSKAQIQQLNHSAVPSQNRPDQICYVIYTSGSTGKPKGVQVPHGSVVNFLYSMKKTPGFTSEDSVLAVTTLSFDISVLELYLPTISGGRVVILDSKTASDGFRLADQIQQNDITLLQATPSTWRLLIQSGWEGKKDLKVLCGGEPMPSDLVGPLLDRCSQLWNMYGPTETTVWSAAFQITDKNAPILIGKPIGNTQIYLLDQNGNEVPPGCEGEVFIGGAGVTLGYKNREDLTAERFVANRYRNPFANYVSDKLYRTGDLARFCHDGNIQFLRRTDKQVKVRGFRIELEEIENVIQTHPLVTQNVVVVRDDKPGDAKLVAYYVGDENAISASDLRNHSKQSLPYYMIPQHFVHLNAMPQTNNGKVDYKSLPSPGSAELERPRLETNPGRSSSNIPESDSLTAAEIFLMDCWKGILETDDVETTDLFFDIGGHSLLVMRVISVVKENTGIELGPQDFLTLTLEQMADRISDSHRFQSESDLELKAGKERAEARSTDTQSEDRSLEGKSLNKTIGDENSDQIDSSEKGSEKPKNIFRKLKGFWD